MKIETKFNTEDTVYFLSAEPDYIDNNSSNHYVKTGEVFVIRGKVGRVSVECYNTDRYEVVYQVFIRALGYMKDIRVCEEMLAPDLIQLGQNVTNRFYVSGKNEKS